MAERKLEPGEIKFILDEARIQAKELLRQQLRRYNPVDLAEILEDLEAEERLRLIEALEIETAAEVLDETDPASRQDLLNLLPSIRISQIVDALPPDEGADLVSSLPPEQQTEVLDTVDEEYAEDLKELMEYLPDTAGGHMTTDFVTIPETATVEQALEKLRGETEMETIVYLYVVDGKEQLKGVVSVRDLLEHEPGAAIEDFMQRDVVTVEPELDQEDVANVVNRYNLNAVPVVDAGGHMLGIVTVDDVLDVIDEEVDEDMFRIAGTASRDPARERLFKKYLKRLPFLLTTFVGGGLTVLVHYLFRITTEQLVALTFFIPVIIGISGNVALQASTIMVRSFATDDIELKDVFRLLPLEAGTGALIGLTFGLACGGITAVASQSLGSTPWLGLVVGVSLASGTTLAACLGVLVPSLCEWTGIDPALAAGPFIVTLIDASALTLYLGIAATMFNALL